MSASERVEREGRNHMVYTQSDVEAPKPVIEQLLPVCLSQPSLSVATQQESVGLATERKRRLDIYRFYAPNLENIFPGLVLHYLVSQIYGALLEGAISEQTARMTAMKQA